MTRGLALLSAAAAVAAVGFVPARRLEGPLPPVPSPLTVGWIEETVDASVDAAGRVDRFTLVRGVKSATSLLGSVVPTWRFSAAGDDDGPARTHVLIALAMRPPQLYDEPSVGEPARELAAASSEVPYPIATRRPRYPPRAIGDAVVIVEVLVGDNGRVSRATALQGTGVFAEEAAATAQAWTFRPAVRAGKPVDAYAYLIFGFRQPVVPPSRGRP